MSYRMKRICALLGAAVIASGLFACGSSSADNSTENTESASQIVDGMLDASEMFTDRDKEVGYDEESAVKISLSDSGIECDGTGVSVEDGIVTITEEGTYIISGTISEGQIVVDADDAKVQLVLNGVDITSSDSAAIYVKSADKVFITTTEGSENNLSTSGEFTADGDTNVDAVIFAKDDITLNGLGSLTINSAYGHGIVSKDDLKITSGTYNITAASTGLTGKDSVRIADGDITITSGKDGIHSENEDDTDKGFVFIAGGTINITCEGDGIDASSIVQVEDGDINILSAGGSQNGRSHMDQMPGGGQDMGQMPQGGQAPDQNSDSSDGTTPPDMSQMPQGGQAPDQNSDSSDGTTPPDMTQMPQDGQAQDQSQGKTASAETSDSSDDDTESSTSTKGIKADTALYILGGSFNIDSADDSIHSNGLMQIEDGSFQLSSGDDGMHADGALTVDGGSITVSTCYEGIEGLTITVNDGDIDIVSSDDGFNAAGDENNNTENMWLEINGGDIHVYADGDGLDSNGNLTINGGTVFIEGPSNDGNSAIDYGDGCEFFMNDGQIVALGYSGMAEPVSDSSAQASMLVALDTAESGGSVSLTDESGNEIVSVSTEKSFNCVFISAPSLEKGSTYTLTAGSSTSSIEMTDTIYNNNTNTMGGMGGRPM